MKQVTQADAVVVGSGIFGSIIARGFRRAGLSVITVDAKRENAGSAPAACLLKPSWYTALGKDVYEPALSMLGMLVGVEEISFKVLAGRTLVQWCNPKKVLLPDDEVIYDTVTAVNPCGKSGANVVLKRGGTINARVVVIAAGIWTPLFFPEIKVVGQAGAAWLWPEAKTDEPRIKVWAPYKQLVAFNRGDGLWVGDGTSVQTWSDAYQEASLKRCRALAAEDNCAGAEPTMLMGYRPYVAGSGPCMLKEMHRGVWVATGGAKNGTLAAGWCADQLVRAVA